MVRCLARDTTAGPVLFRRQLPPQMLLVDHLLRTSLFPLQHYVQRRGAILEALYRISEEVPDEVAEDPPRGDDPVPEEEVEVARNPVPDLSPPSPPPHPSFTAPADTPGPSYTAQHSPEHVHVSSRELAAVMDVVCSLATTQVSQDQRLARAEATLEHCHTMLLQIMRHLGLPPEPAQRDQPPAAASLDMLAAATAASDPPPPRE